MRASPLYVLIGLSVLLITGVVVVSPIRSQFSLDQLFSLVNHQEEKVLSTTAFAQTSCDDASYNNWPQVAHDAQRSGYTDDPTPGTNFTAIRVHPFQPDKVHASIQPIVYCGRVFVGTEGANGMSPSLHIFNAQTGLPESGSPKAVGGPILASVAGGGGYVFLGAMDGALYLFDAQTGVQLDKVQTSSLYGFSTSPVFAENKFMIGRRDGMFFAYDVNTTTGKLRKLWEYNVGAPILQTAAYSNGKVYFGAMDMYTYALNTTNGTLAWKSNVKLHGNAIKDYWPVVVPNVGSVNNVGSFGDLVFVGTYPEGGLDQGNDSRMRVFPLVSMNFLNPNNISASQSAAISSSWLQTYGSQVEQGNFPQTTTLDINGNPTTITVAEAQDTKLATDSEYNPTSTATRTLFVFDAMDGQEAFRLPHWVRPGTHNGSPSPPCVKDGDLITPVQFIGGDLLNWGRMDINTRRVTDIFYQENVGLHNDDETYAKTCTQNLVFTKHWSEATGAAYNGVFNLNSRQWTNIKKATYVDNRLQNNTLSGGVGPAAVSNGLMYSIAGHNLILRSTQ